MADGRRRNGGARPNSGPKKGAKYAPTLHREAAEAYYRKHWAHRFDALLNAQYLTALGESVMVHRDKAGRYKVLETADEIQAHANLGDTLEIKTRQANAQAQMDILNRIIGKPADTHKVTGEDGGPVEHTFRWLK